MYKIEGPRWHTNKVRMWKNEGPKMYDDMGQNIQ